MDKEQFSFWFCPKTLHHTGQVGLLVESWTSNLTNTGSILGEFDKTFDRSACSTTLSYMITPHSKSVTSTTIAFDPAAAPESD